MSSISKWIAKNPCLTAARFLVTVSVPIIAIISPAIYRKRKHLRSIPSKAPLKMETFSYIKDDLFKSLEKEITSGNQQLLNTLRGKSQILYSVEHIKISFSENLLDDVYFLINLSGQPFFKARHANLILRDMLEQVIEFIYLMKHPELIKDYLGDNIDIDKLNFQDSISAMHELGSKRFPKGRTSVSKMAQDIGEKGTFQDRLSLYKIYEILSEECHNSYFFAAMDDIEIIETKEQISALTENQYMYMITILDCFMEKYRV